MSGVATELSILITASTGEAEAKIGALSGSLDGKLSRAAGIARLAMLGLGAAVVGGIVEIGLAAKAASDYQVQQAQLRTATNDAGVSFKKFGGHILDVITKEAELSGFQRGDLMQSFGRLVTATGNAHAAFKLQGEAMDLARARGIDLASAQTILAKVWNGNTTSLVRLGIMVPKVTAAYDALQAKTGTATAAQKAAAKATDLISSRQAALAALQQKFGGQAQAYGNTAAGAMDRFKVALDDLQVTIGTAFLPALTKGLTLVADWVNVLQHSKTAAKIAGDATGALGPIWTVLTFQVRTAASLIRSHWTQIVAAAKSALHWFQGNLLPALSGIFNTLIVVAGNLAKGFEQAWPSIKKAITSTWTAIHPILTLLGNLLANVIEPALIWLSKHSGTAFTAIADAVQIIATVATPIISALATAIQAVIDSMRWVAQHLADLNPLGGGGGSTGRKVHAGAGRGGSGGLPGNNPTPGSTPGSPTKAGANVSVVVHNSGTTRLTGQDVGRAVSWELRKVGIARPSRRQPSRCRTPRRRYSWPRKTAQPAGQARIKASPSRTSAPTRSGSETRP